MRRALIPALLLAGCATIQVPPERSVVPPAPFDGPEVCALIGERRDRLTLSGVAEFSFAPWQMVIGSVVVRHPRGLLVIDPAFGRLIDSDLARAPLWFRVVVGDAGSKTPLVELLARAGLSAKDVRFAALTHAHWDHAGALGDLPRALISISRDELAWIKTLKGDLSGGAIPRQFVRAGKRFLPFDFEGPPLLGFPASHDLFGDQTVIAVPMAGHSPGSTGYLLAGPGGKRWLLAGDAAWTLRGVELPAQKNPLTRFVDHDGVATELTLGRLHAVLRDAPAVQVVPMHDLRAFGTIPICTPVSVGAGPPALR